jgi:4-diphosphocytidyl-2-C-methyl-D-erythritol kinase
VNGERRLAVLTPAKLNLGLAVAGERPDGFHDIVTIMQTVSIYDRLSFESLPGREDLILDVSDEDLAGDDNLVLRAARLLRETTSTTIGTRMSLVKGIPTAAGLGGASSDAAAALVALDRLWGTDLGPEQLGDLALTLGSDVPFFLRGGTALATGRGERLEPLAPLNGVWFVVIVPSLLFPIPHKTATLYAKLTRRDYSEGLLVRSLPGTFRSWFLPRPAMSYNPFANAFLGPLHRLRPQLRDVIGALEAAGAPFVCLSGAGPAHYTGTIEQSSAERLAALVRRRLAGRAEVLVCEPVAGPPWIVNA